MHHRHLLASASITAAGLLCSTAIATAAPRVTVSGGFIDGHTLVLKVTGGAGKAIQWQRCTVAMRAGVCAKPKAIRRGTRLTLTRLVGIRVRAVVTLRGSGRKIATAWRVVAAAPAPPVPPAPVTAPVVAPAPVVRAGSLRTSPIPLGQAQVVSDGWTIRTVSFTPDATVAVMAENMFNDPPVAGRQFAIARVEATNSGTSPDSFGGSYRLRAVGASNVSLSTFRDSCGVIPDDISSAQVFPGGSIAGNVCWSVPSTDIGDLVMYDASSYSADAWTYFALR